MTMIVQERNEGWYIRDLSPGQGRQLWQITDRTATRVGVTNPEGGAGTYFAANPGETIWQCLRRSTPWLDGLEEHSPFNRMRLGPGRYYPRIARPIATLDNEKLWLPGTANEQRYLTSAQNQLGSLIDDLRTICRVVQPARATLSVYGHEIRNLLILAATEVEMHWRGILIANGRKNTCSTRHYVNLAEPLKLLDYTVRFHSCPDIGPVIPFAGWDSTAPTKSLPWYAAYNGVKHNREFEFESASLGNAFDAVAACAALLVAQFGRGALTHELSSFLTVEAPTWIIGDMYLMPETEGNWRPVPHPDLSA